MRSRTRPNSRVFVASGAVAAVALAVVAAGPAGPASGAAGLIRTDAGLLATCDDSFDVDANGVNDLAVGVPGENVGKSKSGVNAGTVVLVEGADVNVNPYGGRGSQVLKSEDVGQNSERNDRFGSAVLVADVNGDGCRDLVIGVPGENHGRGRVIVAFGSATGLVGHQSLHQDTKGVPGEAEKGDQFGATLAVSGVMGGGLWVGAPGEDVGKVRNAGAMTWFPFGVAGGRLPASDAEAFTTKTDGVPGSPTAGNRFGSVLMGTSNALYVGVPRQRVDGKGSAGAVYTLNGSWSVMRQGDGAPGKNEKGDRFGAALALVSCPGNPGDVLAVGTPGENVGKLSDAGTVAVIGSGASSVISQDSPSVPNEAEKDDLFGRSLTGLGRTLAIGVPGENYKGRKNAGLVAQMTLECSSNPAVVDALNVKPLFANSGDRFGLVLAGGIMKSVAPTRPLLLVGSPQEAGTGGLDSGTVAVFEDADEDNLFGDRVAGVSQRNVKGKGENFDFFGAAVGAVW